MQLKSSFFILWTALGQYEWVENWPSEDGPHGYAWDHNYYEKSNYIIIPMEAYPKEFAETPEDTLLNSIFNKQ